MLFKIKFLLLYSKMQQFDKEFEYINSVKNKIKQKRDRNDYCYDCYTNKFYEPFSDNYICEMCGSCTKAFGEYITFNDSKSYKIRAKSQRHKYLRLKRKYKKMKIEDDKLKEKLNKKFSQIIVYFDRTTYLNRKNILRYDYIILKFLEIINEIDKTDYKLNLTKDTIKKYDKIWKDFCDIQQYKFIKTPL